jgi:hypothetical protein
MPKRNRKRHKWHYGALIPHTGTKGVKLIYKSPRMKLSIEIFGNVLLYREFWKRAGKWIFARSKFAFNNLDPVMDWTEELREYKYRILEDADKDDWDDVNYPTEGGQAYNGKDAKQVWECSGNF